MSHPSNASIVVVGVAPRQSAAVVEQAAVFAERFGAELLCAWVDPARYAVRELPDGAIVSMPLDPDVPDEEVEPFPPDLHATIADTLSGRPVRWTVRGLAGGTAQELARVAEEVDAAMIVVGTREAGMRGSLHTFFNGSVAVHLAHRQHRPVVVIPLNPVTGDEDLPWRKDDS